MKFSFITASLCALLVICGACTNEDWINSRGGTDSDRIPLTIRAIASNFNNFPVYGNPSTRIPLESGSTTIFNKGDAIGIFGIKNGAIVDGIDNIKLTFTKTGLETGDWNPPTGISLYWSEGMKYISYYPYKEGITIDATKSTDDIIASLTDKLKPIKDQSDPDKYTACDLMISSVSELTSDGSSSVNNILKLEFEHQFTLLVLKPQAKFQYVSPGDTVYTYRAATSELIVDVTAKQVTINDVTPCKMDDGSYRAIVIPDSITRIAGSYITTDISTNKDKKLTYSGEKISFVTGTCYTLTVKSPLASSEKERALAPGDFVFFDENNKIEIYPGDGDFEGETIPDYENAVGMVITCDPQKMRDSLCKAKGWAHAYVMGLKIIGSGSWGDPTVNETIQEMTVNDSIENNMNGYLETETILETYEGDLSKRTAFQKIKEYRGKNIIPDNGICSPWFMPSIGQWFDMLVNICGRSPRDFKNNNTVGLEDHNWGTETRDKLNKQLAKVGSSIGELENYRRIFWSSTEYNISSSWILIWHFEVMDDGFWDRVGIKAYDKASSSGYYVIPFFAF